MKKIFVLATTLLFSIFSFGYEFVNDGRIESWQVIVQYLNGLQDMNIVDVLPSLSRVTRSRRVIESFMSPLIDSVFYNCKTGSEVISLADKLIHDISTKMSLQTPYLIINIGMSTWICFLQLAMMVLRKKGKKYTERLAKNCKRS